MKRPAGPALRPTRRRPSPAARRLANLGRGDGRLKNARLPPIAAARRVPPDEVHHAGGSNWRETAVCCRPAYIPSYRRLAIQAAAPSDVWACEIEGQTTKVAQRNERCLAGAC